ncbi:MAG: bifunctional 4-hydroxy-2-oxoglutarate aldolase/2-dehydro-3-deoxy-phosphogluconate aldolase [Verrucomicrobiota bacterium]
MSLLTLDSEPGRAIAKARLISVLMMEDIEAALPLAESLLNGGIRVMELTLRTPAALEAATLIASKFPEMTVGIGTVINLEQTDAALAAGAAFGVSPGTNPNLIRHATRIGLPFGPGIMTPTDIDVAIREGCLIQKYFPAESSGGLKHLKNIAAPFAHLGARFIPLGGVTLRNAIEYLESDLVVAVGGSWIAPQGLIQEKDWDQIEANAREAARLIG